MQKGRGIAMGYRRYKTILAEQKEFNNQMAVELVALRRDLRACNNTIEVKEKQTKKSLAEQEKRICRIDNECGCNKSSTRILFKALNRIEKTINANKAKISDLYILLGIFAVIMAVISVIQYLM